jgi:hypothetical protein
MDADEQQRLAELEAKVEAQQSTLEKMLPGRRAVLAGLAGAGAGAVGMRSATDDASAQAVGQIGTDSEPVDVEAETVDASAVNADELLAEPWSYRDPDVKAPHASTGAVTIHVSPSGSDSNDGTQSNPVATIKEALSRIPKNLNHDVRVWLDYGDYTANGNRRLQNTFITADGISFQVVGHRSDNPFYNSSNSANDVRMDYWLFSGLYGSEEISTDGINVEGVWQAYSSDLWLKNMILETGGAGNNQLLDVKKGGHVQVSNSTFQDAQRVSQVNNGGQLTFVDCDASNISGTPVSANVGSIVSFNNSDSIITASSDDPSVSEGSLFLGGPAGIKHNRAAGGSITTTTNQTLAHNTLETVTFDTERFNIDETGFVDLANNQITIQREGLYRVQGKIVWNNISALTNIYLEAEIAINGSNNFPTGNTVTSRANDETEITNVDMVFDAADGDNITLRGRHRNGSEVTDAIAAAELTVTQES